MNESTEAQDTTAVQTLPDINYNYAMVSAKFPRRKPRILCAGVGSTNPRCLWLLLDVWLGVQPEKFLTEKDKKQNEQDGRVDNIKGFIKVKYQYKDIYFILCCSKF